MTSLVTCVSANSKRRVNLSFTINNERGGIEMKKFISRHIWKLGSCVASLAVMMTVVTANSACVWFTHQEKLPEEAKKLRKF